MMVVLAMLSRASLVRKAVWGVIRTCSDSKNSAAQLASP